MREETARFVEAQWRRIALGCTLGSLVAALFHLMLRDSGFTSSLPAGWTNSSIRKSFDGFGAYSPELTTSCIGIAAIAAVPAFLWFRRYARAWWVGITSFTTLSAICATVAALTYARTYPWSTVALGLLCVAAVLAVEYWRQLPLPHPPGAEPFKLKIPITKGGASAEQRWDAPSSDNPIGDWDQDILGRASVVEVLAEHALRLRTPIVALHGGFGDGKTSVLNLLRKAVEGQAIVVSFSAWLPGSEATLAADLFGDIATECKKHVHVPQLRKRVLAYARTLTGSVSYLAGLKELLPTRSQRQEVQELHNALSRVPLPILVLLDEIDRMQKEEILVLLKILRGVPSIPNVSFVCAFNEEEIKRRLSAGDGTSDDYLEKFFPVSVSLSPPSPDLLARLFQSRLQRGLEEQKWFDAKESEEKFSRLLERLWQQSLSRICTNIRRAGLLLNGILTAARPITREVNAFDLTAIETVRRFYPRIYGMIRTNSVLLTFGTSSWTNGQYISEERKTRDSEPFFKTLNEEIAKSQEPAACKALLSWLFPAYAAALGAALATVARPTNEDIAEDEKRICSPNYFSIYFRAAVPEEMFSNAELDGIVSDLNQAKTETDVETLFGRMLDSIPQKHPKREDSLWKLSRGIDRLSDIAAERLAYAAASRAVEYDIIIIGDGARAVNLVFAAAQKLSETMVAQRTLEGAIARSSDDTLAEEILQYVENPGRNKILTNFSNIKPAEVKRAFIERMRKRYGPDRDFTAVNLVQADWHAFRIWINNSDEDREAEQEFWRRFIGQSRKRLAQAINFLYPGGNVVWEQDPTPIVDQFFPTRDIASLLGTLPEEEHLDPVEAEAIVRMQELRGGKFQKLPTL